MKITSHALAFLIALAGPAMAQDGALTGTLAKIHNAGKIVLGVRESALPFSYRPPNSEPIGYAVDLCRELIKDISSALGGAQIGITYRIVTPENRINLVVSGDVDLECGSTTRNQQRLQLVAFSPVFYIAGTKLLVSRESGIRSYRDLKDKTVVVPSGTTNETALHALVDQLLLHFKIITAPDVAQAFTRLRNNEADAFASDDVLLAGLAASRQGADYHVVGGFLSYDPYGLMYRKNDPAFDAVIQRGFRRLAASRTLSTLYDRWLMDRLPTGERLGIPLSSELAEKFRELGEPD